VDLYELFHLTNQLGGYEQVHLCKSALMLQIKIYVYFQVTLSNKWKSVFNALGGKEITAAATYTRKHYEK